MVSVLIESFIMNSVVCGNECSRSGSYIGSACRLSKERLDHIKEVGVGVEHVISIRSSIPLFGPPPQTLRTRTSRSSIERHEVSVSISTCNQLGNIEDQSENHYCQ
jgi:hypothetical protein